MIDKALRITLLESAKESLIGYHIDLSKYTEYITENNDNQIEILFLSNETNKTIKIIPIIYKTGEILTCKIELD